jgi:predicted RNase H-like HicB family nuclease
MTRAMAPMTFTAEVHFEDGSYWAQIREVPGCFASGDTLDELFEGLREAIQMSLEDEDAGAKLDIASAILSSEPVPA